MMIWSQILCQYDLDRFTQAGWIIWPGLTPTREHLTRKPFTGCIVLLARYIFQICTVESRKGLAGPSSHQLSTGSKKLQIFISFSVHFQISGDIHIGNNLASVNLDLLRRHLIHHPIIQSQSSFITTNKPEAVLCSQAAHPEPPLQSQQLLRHPIFHTF